MKKTVNTLSVIYYLFYIGALLAAVAGYCLSTKTNLCIDEKSSAGIAISSVYLIYLIVSIPVVLGVFHYFTKKWADLDNRDLKLTKYKKWAEIRIIALGISVVTGVFLFYLLSSESMLFGAVIGAIALIFSKPREAKVVSELKLTNEDIDYYNRNR
jgi:DMSO reductase anchor subunit